MGQGGGEDGTGWEAGTDGERLSQGEWTEDVQHADPSGPSKWASIPVAADTKVSNLKQLQG